MGLGRFQANLIIAAVQHQAGSDPLPNPLAGSHPIRSLPSDYRGRKIRSERLVILAVILGVQILIAMTVWGLWFR
jgi:hypothetical protein